MDKPNIQPEKITKPIQLLAVWFAGLVLLVGLLLTGAKTITEPLWLVPVLAISSIVIIPIFLYFVFLLQTKYRPQMQEDTFYSEYLDKTTNKPVNKAEISVSSNTLVELQNQVNLLTEKYKAQLSSFEDLLEENKTTNVSSPERIHQLRAIIQNTTEGITKVEETIKKSTFTLQLNRLLPDFQKIRLELLKSGFENLSEFTGGSGKPPKTFLISAGRNVTPSFLVETIKTLRPLKLEKVSLIIDEDNVVIDMHADEIVVGSYAYENPERIIMNLDDTFIQTLEQINSIETLHGIFRK